VNRVLLIIGIIVAVAKAIAELVEIVEIPGNGEAKKKAMLDLLGAIYDETNKLVALPVSRERLLAIAGSLIDVIVAIYNALGIFRSKVAA